MARKLLARGALGFLIALCGAGAAYGHHSFAMFDATKTYTWVGTLERLDWENPHCHIIINVPPGAKDKRTVGRWDIEGGAPNIMARQGWTKIIFKKGDPITIVGNPMRNGSKGGALFYAMTGDGKKLYHDVKRDSSPAGPAPSASPAKK